MNKFKVGDRIEYNHQDCGCCFDEGVIFDIVLHPTWRTRYIIQPDKIELDEDNIFPEDIPYHIWIEDKK